MTGKTDTDKPKKTAFWRRSGKKESKTRDPNSQQPSQPISKAPKGKRLSEKEVLKAREEAQAKKQDVPEDAPPAYFAAEEPAATKPLALLEPPSAGPSTPRPKPKPKPEEDDFPFFEQPQPSQRRLIQRPPQSEEPFDDEAEVTYNAPEKDQEEEVEEFINHYGKGKAPLVRQQPSRRGGFGGAVRQQAYHAQGPPERQNPRPRQMQEQEEDFSYADQEDTYEQPIPRPIRRTPTMQMERSQSTQRMRPRPQFQGFQDEDEGYGKGAMVPYQQEAGLMVPYQQQRGPMNQYQQQFGRTNQHQQQYEPMMSYQQQYGQMPSYGHQMMPTHGHGQMPPPPNDMRSLVEMFMVHNQIASSTQATAMMEQKMLAHQNQMKQELKQAKDELEKERMRNELRATQDQMKAMQEEMKTDKLRQEFSLKMVEQQLGDQKLQTMEAQMEAGKSAQAAAEAWKSAKKSKKDKVKNQPITIQNTVHGAQSTQNQTSTQAGYGGWGGPGWYGGRYAYPGYGRLGWW